MLVPRHFILVCMTTCAALLLTMPMAKASAAIEVAQAANADKLALQSSLTESERHWLRQHPTIRHGIISNQMPFEYVDSSDQYRGLTSDYIAIISEQLDIDFEPSFFSLSLIHI